MTNSATFHAQREPSQSGVRSVHPVLPMIAKTPAPVKMTCSYSNLIRKLHDSLLIESRQRERGGRERLLKVKERDVTSNQIPGYRSNNTRRHVTLQAPQAVKANGSLTTRMSRGGG